MPKKARGAAWGGVAMYPAWHIHFIYVTVYEEVLRSAVVIMPRLIVQVIGGGNGRTVHRNESTIQCELICK